MTPLRHELIVAASLHNVGLRSPIDLKIESHIRSKVRGPQNNKTSARLSDGGFGGRARLCWTRTSCRRRYLPMQWKWAVAGLGRSHVRAALWRTLQNQQQFHTAKCLPHAMKNPEPSASALPLESAPRASAVDRLARMPHQPRGPFPEVCATFHSRGRKAA